MFKLTCDKYLAVQNKLRSEYTAAHRAGGPSMLKCSSSMLFIKHNAFIEGLGYQEALFGMNLDNMNQHDTTNQRHQRKAI